MYSHFCFHCLLLTGHKILQPSPFTNHTCFHEVELKKMWTENVEKMTRHLNELNEALKMLEQIKNERNACQHQELKIALSQSSTVLSMPTLLEQFSPVVFVLVIVIAKGKVGETPNANQTNETKGEGMK